YFGKAVAISGSTVVVGAYGHGGAHGAAYVYVGSGGIWSQQAKLPPGSGSGFFGFGVAISGSTIVIGAPYAQTAFVFVRSGGTWRKQARLTASESGAVLFGWSVAAWKSRAVVGDPARDGSAGAVHVFRRSQGSWSEEARLSASDGEMGDDLGYGVSIWRSMIVSGAPFKAEN